MFSFLLFSYFVGGVYMYALVEGRGNKGSADGNEGQSTCVDLPCRYHTMCFIILYLSHVAVGALWHPQASKHWMI